MSFNQRVEEVMERLGLKNRPQAIGIVREQDKKAKKEKEMKRIWELNAPSRAEKKAKNEAIKALKEKEERLLEEKRLKEIEIKEIQEALEQMVKSQISWVSSPTWFLGGTTTEHFNDILPTIIEELNAILEEVEEIRFKDFFSHCFDKFSSHPYYKYWIMIGDTKRDNAEFYRFGTVNLNVKLNELFADKIRKDGGARYFTK